MTRRSPNPNFLLFGTPKYRVGFPHNKGNCISNLDTCLKNTFFIMETLHIPSKSKELSFETNSDIIAISKVKYRSHHLYQKKKNLNTGLVNRYYIREHKFNAFSSKELSFNLILTTFLLK